MYRGVAIGAGYFSKFHYDAWQRLPTAELVAACDLDENIVASAVDNYGVPRKYTDYVEMFDAEQPDFVDIITPPQTHAEICAEAASRGIHIICQKPLAPSFDEAAMLTQQMEDAPVRFMVHENFRFQPWHREIRRLIDSGIIGSRLHSLAFRTRTGDGWGDDAYLARQPYFREYPQLLVYETGVHFVDTFRYLGGEVDSVYARLRRLNDQIAGEDCGIIIFNFAGGTVGTWDANRYNEPNYDNPRYTFGEFLVEGNGGSIRLYPDGRLTVQALGSTEADHEYEHTDIGFAGDCCLATEISEELGLTKADYAIIVNVFTFAYAFGQTLFGKIFDWIGTRLGFVLSITVWSIATMLHAIAAGLASFVAFRALLGVSEAGNWPGATKANAEWFPIKERALAQGIFNSGAAIGGIISAPFVAYLFVYLGSWQATFITIGALGLLWLIPWLIVYKTGPDKHPWVSETEREYILTGQRNVETNEVATYAPGAGEILSRKESWGVILASFFLDPIWWLFILWLPLYLAETYGFGVAEIGKYAWVPYVGAMFGAWFGGLLAQNRISAGWTVNRVRKFVISLGGLIMLVSLLMTMKAATPMVAVLLMAAILFRFQVAVGNIQTLPSDFYSGDSVGTLAGYAGTAAKLAVVLMNFLIPVITVNSYGPAFAVGAALAILTVLSVWVFCRKIQPLTPKN